MHIFDHPSPNYGSRNGQAIDMLVIHSIGVADLKAAFEILCDPAQEVSAHYLITMGGHVYRLVDEEHRAWHAGVSYWKGETDINSRSIGIELEVPRSHYAGDFFPLEQMRVLTRLCKDILGRYPIPPDNIVAHSDIAPGRKIDPGSFFDWEKWAQDGIGQWPGPQPDKESLVEYGYNPDLPADVLLEAWHLHFGAKQFTS